MIYFVIASIEKLDLESGFQNILDGEEAVLTKSLHRNG